MVKEVACEAAIFFHNFVNEIFENLIVFGNLEDCKPGWLPPIYECD